MFFKIFKEFIKLFNEDMDYMRGEEYDKMKKEERINKKKKIKMMKLMIIISILMST